MDYNDFCTKCGKGSERAKLCTCHEETQTPVAKHVRPDWDAYWLNVAKVISSRSTCLRRRYGAVIVTADNVIVSTGYNGAARGEINCCDIGVCERERLNIPAGQNYELCKAGGAHAEVNAIINGDPVKMRGATIYIAGFNADGTPAASSKPCLMCERVIKNAQIARIVE